MSCLEGLLALPRKVAFALTTQWRVVLWGAGNYVIGAVMVNIVTLGHQANFGPMAHATKARALTRLPDIVDPIVIQTPEMDAVIESTWPFIAGWALVVVLLNIHVEDWYTMTEFVFLFAGGAFFTNLGAILTVLPNPEACVDPLNEEMYHSAGWWLLTKLDNKGCGDMIWSGHSSNTVILSAYSLRFIQRHGAGLGAPWSELCRGLVLPIAVYNTVPMLIGGCHYTVDIYLGLLLGLLFVTHPWIPLLARKMYNDPGGQLEVSFEPLRRLE